MIDIELMSELVGERQAYLRSLAARPVGGRQSGTARQALGRLVIRFGRWVEGCRPEVVAEPAVTGPMRTA